MKIAKLASLMSIKTLQNEAWDETRDLTERHDVPNGENVPDDLRDIIGFYRNTKNGYRISGRLLPSDLLQGSPSSAVPLFLAFAAILATFGVAIGELGQWTKFIIVPLGVLYIISLFIIEGFLISLLTLIVFSAAIGGGLMPAVPMALSIGQNVGILLLAFFPIFYFMWIRKERVSKLAKRGTEVAHESTGEYSSSHVRARKIQAENAEKDTSPFISIGEATGSFHASQDPYAPDPGLPFGLTCKDLSTHLVVFGATGTGKTAGVLRPVTNKYLDSKYGGALILDGKGQLAKEFSNRDGYVYIEPGSAQLALFEGLDATDIVQAIVSLQDTGGGGENGSFFTSSGQQLLLSTAVIACTLSKKNSVKFPLTFKFLYNLIDTLTDKEKATDTLKYLNTARLSDPLLTDAIQYFDVKLPAMDSKTRSNIIAVCVSWLSPIMSNPKIREWAELSTGDDVTICLRGGVVGVNVPASEYGEAGRVITALVKARIFRSIKRRASDWEEKGIDKPMLMVVDEAQAVIGPMELELFPVARSLGLMGLYATQSVDEFVGKFGVNQALALLNNFRSFIIFQSSQATYEWAMSRIGTSMVSRPVAKIQSADAAFAAELAAGSPVFDRDHPNRKQMKLLARNNLGGVWSVAKAGFGLIGGGNELDMDFKTSIKSEEIQILTPIRASMSLATPFNAVAQVMRGGVSRRDVVKITVNFK